MSFIPSLRGVLTIELISAEPAKALDDITNSGIPISDIQMKSELIFRFRLHQRDLKHVSHILRKRGDQFSIISRHGIFWQFKTLLNRPALVSIVLIMLSATAYLPTRVLFIETEGNQMLSSEEILAAAETCGISFGASRKHIRSEKVKNQLLSLLPELQWAGINTVGCRAVISVRERAEAKKQHPEHYVSSLVAGQDAYILSTTITEGTLMVHPGDSVVAGQTLVSGYADNGFSIHATKAAGEILGLTGRTETAAMPDNYLLATDIEGIKYKISLLLRKKRINLWKDSRISNACCGRMYEEYFVSLPGGFRLPLAVSIDRYICYTINRQTVPESEAYTMLSEFSDTYLKGQMIAGQILQKKQQLSMTENIYQLKSSYICSEMIGQEQREQIGDHNGKRN